MSDRKPVFETERLLLTPRSEADVDRVVELNADPDVLRYLALPGDPSMARAAVAARTAALAGSSLGYWSVTPRSDPQTFLGYVGLIPGRADGTSVELSYRFHRKFWGAGFAFEAARRLIDHGFGDLGLDQVTVVTHPGNAPSLKLAEKLRFARQPDRLAPMMGRNDFLCAIYALDRDCWQRG